MNLIQHDYVKDSEYKDQISRVKAIDMIERNEEEGEPIAKKRFKTVDKVYSYKITLNNPQPNLIPEKLIEFKVPNGPLCGALKRGESVILPDGKTKVNPEDVCDYSQIKEDIKILALDCLNENYLDFIENNDEINDKQVSLIVHLSNSKLFLNKRYKAWIESRDYAKHVILDETKENIKSMKQLYHQKTLNLLDDKIYPLFPKFKGSNETFLNSKNIQYGFSNTKINFRPNVQIITSNCYKEPTVEEIRQGLILDADEDIDEKLKQVRLQVKELREKQTQENYPIVTFLGTGSSTPGILRNASGVLFEINKNNSILLDCGEGTLEQIMSLYGDGEYKNKLLKLNAIFISHFHADHIQGLFSIITERKRVFDELNIKYENLFLLVPLNIVDYLRVYFEYFDKNIFNYVEIIVNFDLYPAEERNTGANVYTGEQNKIKYLIEILNLKTIKAVPVIHVSQSSGLVLETKETSFKLVFSGDCRPSDTLINYGSNCDLLIHEATFDPIMINDAISKKHSTSTEAVKVGKKMNAKSTILWHFSQRYHKIPIMNEVINYNNVGVSFDNMIIKRNDLEIIPLFNETIKSLFRKEHELIENKKNY
jgi:ribonuclease Z